MKSVKRQVIEKKFKELYLDHTSDFDIEFLYNYIVNYMKIPNRRYNNDEI